ncbi:MAG: polysaccharide biosynthesis protein [Bacteroidetes bacterium]|nr:MAG: polysaccharide biosynthesis protein [Bacteroidota bacterium]
MIPRLRHRFGHLFSERGFRGPVLTLLSGSTAVMGLAYVAQPILRRIYTPAAFGLMDVFVSIVGVLMTCASLRYEDALMQPEEEDDAASLWWLALVLMTGFTLLTALAALWNEPLAALLGEPALAPWLLLVAPALFAVRLSKLAELWLTRALRFRTITAAQMAQTLTMLLVRIGAGLPPLRAGTGGLVGGYLAGYLIAGGVLLRQVWRTSRPVLSTAFRPARMVALARRFRRYPLFSMPATLLSAVLMRLPFFLLLYYFDETVVGLLGLAFVALATPLGLVGNAVAQVFFVKAAEARRDGTLGRLSAAVHQRLVALGMFPTLALLVAGPELFAFVFGEAWRTGGVYVQYVGPWLYLAAVAAPLTRLFDVLERQRADLLLSLLMFFVQGGALVAGGLSGDVLRTLLYAGVAGAAMRLIQVDVLLRAAGVPVGPAWRPYLRYGLFSLPFLLPLALVVPLARGWLTAGTALLCGLGYAALVVHRDRLLERRPAPPTPPA